MCQEIESKLSGQLSTFFADRRLSCINLQYRLVRRVPT
jgi:hypothetical protein